VRSSKIVLEANPDYRGFTWDFTSDDPADQPLIAQMKGKRMPQVGRVEISIMEEDQSRLLAFENGELDIMNMEGPLAPKVLNGGELRPDLAKKGVKLSRFVDPEISYHFWNMRDPVVGGMSREKIALRRAMAMAYDVAGEVKVVRNGQAVEAKDPKLANALLDYFGYKKGADGWRTLPDGKPLLVHYTSRPDSLGRQQDEAWKKAFDLIGVRMEVKKEKFSDQLKMERQCKLQMRTASWIADYPDADNFMQLLYSKNIGQQNNACADIPEYDRLYERSIAIPDSPERNRLYHDMTRLIEVYAPWRLDISRYRNMLVQPRVLGYKKHPIVHSEWQFIDVLPKS